MARTGIGCAPAVSAQAATRWPRSRDPAGVVQIRPAGLFTRTGAAGGAQPASRCCRCGRGSALSRCLAHKLVARSPGSPPAAGGNCTLAPAIADHARRDQQEPHLTARTLTKRRATTRSVKRSATMLASTHRRPRRPEIHNISKLPEGR